MIFYSPWLCWLIPIVGAMLTLLIAKVSEKARDYAAVLFGFLAAVMAASMIPSALSGKMFIPGKGLVSIPVDWKYEWIIVPGAKIDVGVLVDPLSVLMSNVVAWISFLILVYSLGYMHGEEGLTRYWFFMNFFIGNMLLLVMSDNILQMLFGWEGVGVCSYQLIGFWYRDERKRWVGDVPPSHAGMKAFIMTRAGDVALMIAAFIIFTQAKTFNFMELQQSHEWIVELAKVGLIVPVGLFLLGGPIGKSAQFPLHEWLPEAMAGPTSVSALIHAATMVKAGVYFIARVFPIFTESFRLAAEDVHNGVRGVILAAQNQFFITVAWIGAFTAFLAASQAMVARELKKVLAYSTVSQIGYMMLGLGAGGLAGEYAASGYVAGVFHLMSHAIFKALLFMAAGSVLHACETTDMFEMGGIRKEMPITFACMLIGALSLSGIPPLSGFWSKEAVFGVCIKSGQYLLLALAAITAAMTFFYSIRMISIAFLGRKSHHLEELEHHGHHVHEVPLVMWIPYLILAIATIGIGLIGPNFEHKLEEFLEPSIYPHHGLRSSLFSLVSSAEAVGVSSMQLMTMAITASMLLLGGVPGYLMYVSRKIDPVEFVNKYNLKPVYNFLWNRWYMNPTYYKVFVYSLINLSSSLFKNLEKAVIDRVNYVVANGVIKMSSKLFRDLEVKIVDGANYVLARAIMTFPGVLKRIQTGVLSYNMIGVVIGLLMIGALLILLGL